MKTWYVQYNLEKGIKRDYGEYPFEWMAKLVVKKLQKRGYLNVLYYGEYHR